MAHGIQTVHLLQEGLVLMVATWLIFGIHRQNAELARLRSELEAAKKMPVEASEAALNARRRLSELMAQQFHTWRLSKSEKEVGLLLLKGLSLKEIAALRGTAEKTIRQQASAICRKAGVTGRHAFSAWFIEDFL